MFLLENSLFKEELKPILQNTFQKIKEEETFPIHFKKLIIY